jgi:hypothetical protein
MSDKQVNREDLPDDYKEWMHLESHHDHVIVQTDSGTLYWKPEIGVEIAMEHLSLSDLINLFYGLGWDTNSEQVREFYRKKGYSLAGYWELFHWEVNNSNASQYKQYVLTPFDGKK